jgi:hypothetical protein
MRASQPMKITITIHKPSDYISNAIRSICYRATLMQEYGLTTIRQYKELMYKLESYTEDEYPQ